MTKAIKANRHTLIERKLCSEKYLNNNSNCMKILLFLSEGNLHVVLILDSSKYRYITWMLHQIFMYSGKVMLGAKLNS